MSDSPPDTQDDLLNSLLSDFLDESDQLLAQLNENLLQLDEWAQSLDEDHDQRCDEDLLNEMFRAAHSLKGLSAMLGLSDINNLTHKVENVFDAARKDELTINGDVVDLMFMGLDQLTALVDLLKEPGAEPVDCDAVIEGIRRLLQSAGVERKQASQADAERALATGVPGATTESSVPGTAAESPDLPPPVAGSNPGPETDPLGDLKDEEEISDRYLSIFIDEAELSLDDLTGTLLALEDGGEGDELRRLLATAHKIKGSAAAVGLNRAAKLAHLMEDLLEGLGETQARLSPELTDVMLKCTDGLRQYVADLKRGRPRSDQFGQLAHELLEAGSADSRADDRSGDEPAPAVDDTAPEKVTASTSESGRTSPAEASAMAGGNRTTFVGHVQFQPDLRVAGLKAQLICEKLAKLGEVSYCDPPAEKLDEVENLDSLRFQVTCDQSRETLAEQLRVAGVQAITVEPLAGGSPPAQPGSKPEGTPPAKSNTGPAPVDSDAGGHDDSKPASAEADPPAKNAAAASSRCSPPPKPPAREAGGRAPENASRPTETVRVDIDRLDHLMDLAGQLVINKAQFAQIGDSLKSVLHCKQSVQALNKVFAELDKIGGQCELRSDAQHSQATGLQLLRSRVRRIQNDLEPVRREMQTLAQARDCVRDLSEAIHQLNRVTEGIQQSVMDTRMVPIGPLFARFNRVIRDVTRANGKNIRLEISGEKTELDKRMIDELGDPLVHMVRNSADHGIESPEEREAAGKPRQGTVTLNAFHRGNSIVIQVSDDGKGLDTDRILHKCLEKGILTQADADKMTPHQLHQMIWEPGLTTAKEVTDISGRGMGMDIVKSKIEDLNGTVDAESTTGQGTVITIRLPLTLAILPSLTVEIAGDVFAMPMEAVVEIVRVGGGDLSRIHGRTMAQVRGRVISLVRLADVLSFHGTVRAAGERHSEDATLVIVGERGREIGLAVDRVIGEQDVVIKSLAENYENVPGIAGASVLGDGRISLILDTAALVDLASQSNTAAAVC
ncbi:MAG TPA: Hpt domain-containing protein [Thermoguttaceae bacterium]|nr:Hpt domain-containing protein [Thermoguttaceae bacterium]